MGISFLFYDFMVDLVSQKIKLFVHFVKHLVDPLLHSIACPLLRAFQIDCKDNSFMSKRVLKCAVRDHYIDTVLLTSMLHSLKKFALDMCFHYHSHRTVFHLNI